MKQEQYKQTEHSKRWDYISWKFGEFVKHCSTLSKEEHDAITDWHEYAADWEEANIEFSDDPGKEEAETIQFAELLHDSYCWEHWQDYYGIKA